MPILLRHRHFPNGISSPKQRWFLHHRKSYLSWLATTKTKRRIRHRGFAEPTRRQNFIEFVTQNRIRECWFAHLSVHVDNPFFKGGQSTNSGLMLCEDGNPSLRSPNDCQLKFSATEGSTKNGLRTPLSKRVTRTAYTNNPFISSFTMETFTTQF